MSVDPMSVNVLFYQIDDENIINLANVVSIESGDRSFFKCKNIEDPRFDVYETLKALIVKVVSGETVHVFYVKDEDGSKFQKISRAISCGGWALA